jgi:hypothetical protein
MRVIASFGAHRMIHEPPDTVVLAGGGAVSGEEMAAMVQALAEWSRGMPFVLMLVDLSTVTSIPAEARRALTLHGKALPPRAIALYGGSFAIRVASTMMERASDLLSRGQKRDRWMHHAGDEAEARQWLAEMRGKLVGAR